MFTLAKRLLLIALVTTASAFAQDTPAETKADNKAEAKEAKEAPFEVFAGYSYLREDGNNLNGWTGTFVGDVYHWLGLAADFDGHYRSGTVAGSSSSEHVYGFTFGPHVALKNKSRVTPIAFALFGGAHANAQDAGIASSNTGFAMNLGGGLDVRLNEVVEARVIQVDASYARFGGKGSTSPRVSAGLVFHFGKH